MAIISVSLAVIMLMELPTVDRRLYIFCATLFSLYLARRSGCLER